MLLLVSLLSLARVVSNEAPPSKAVAPAKLVHARERTAEPALHPSQSATSRHHPLGKPQPSQVTLSFHPIFIWPFVRPVYFRLFAFVERRVG